MHTILQLAPVGSISANMQNWLIHYIWYGLCCLVVYNARVVLVDLPDQCVGVLVMDNEISHEVSELFDKEAVRLQFSGRDCMFVGLSANN